LSPIPWPFSLTLNSPWPLASPTFFFARPFPGQVKRSQPKLYGKKKTEFKTRLVPAKCHPQVLKEFGAAARRGMEIPEVGG